MRLRLLCCVIALMVALSTTIVSTFALFSDYQSVSFTMSAASLGLSLSNNITTGNIPPVLHVTLTNNGTINASLWLSNIYRQPNAVAESEITAQFGIDIHNYFKDVTLEVSYNNTTNTFTIPDLDNPSSLLLMSGIAPGHSATVTIKQNQGSTITLYALKTDTFASAQAGRISSESEASEDNTQAPSEDTVKTETSSEDESENETEPSVEATTEDESETEPSVEATAEDESETEPSVEATTENESETEQSFEPAAPEEVAIKTAKREPAKAAVSYGYYEERCVYVPYVFEFVLTSSSFTSTKEKKGFTLLKSFNIFVSTPEPEDMISRVEYETDENVTETTDETSTASTEDTSTEASGQTIEDITITSETQTTTVQDAKGEPERERFIEPATEPSSEQFINPYMEIKPTDEPEELPTEPALDVSEPLDDHDEE